MISTNTTVVAPRAAPLQPRRPTLAEIRNLSYACSWRHFKPGSWYCSCTIKAVGVLASDNRSQVDRSATRLLQGSLVPSCPAQASELTIWMYLPNVSVLLVWHVLAIYSRRGSVFLITLRGQLEKINCPPQPHLLAHQVDTTDAGQCASSTTLHYIDDAMSDFC